MKIYIAGASSELARCERAVTLACALGHEITLDWTKDVRAATVLDDALSPSRCAELAAADLRAVEQAETLVLLIPKTPSTGCWVELGYALAHSIPVYTCGVRKGIFWALGFSHWASEQACLEALVSKPEAKKGGKK